MKLYQNTLLLVIISLIIVVLSVAVIFEGKQSINMNDVDRTDLISGNVVNTYVQLFPAQAKNCSFHMYPGWNMVSFYCLGMFVDRNAVLSSVSGSYNSIFEYDPTSVNDPWKSYNPYLPSGVVQQITHMDRISGYWIYMYNDANFSYGGVYADSAIALYPGWNFVGYPLNYSSNISSRMQGIQFSIIKYYYTSGDVWLTYVNGNPNNTLIQFSTYKGYWINASANSQWNISRS